MLELLRIIKILVWKRLKTIQQKPWSYIYLEIGITFLFPVLLCIHIQFNQSHESKWQNTTSEFLNLGIPEDRFTSTRNLKICYMPNATLTTEIMVEANKFLKIKESRLRPCPTNVKINRDVYKVAFMNFSDHDDISQIDKLEYEIETGKNLQTGTIYAEEVNLRSHSNYGHDYKNVAAMQSAIDQSFIKLKTGNEIKQRLTYQELSFPHVKDSTYTQIGISSLTLMFGVSLILFQSQLVTRIVEERLSGFEEMQIIAGVTSLPFLLSQLIVCIPTILVFVILNTVIVHKECSIINITHGNIIIFMILLLSLILAVIAVGFVLGRVITSLTDLSVIAQMTMMFLLLIALFVGSKMLSNYALIVFIALWNPWLPFMLAIRDIYILEDLGIGVNFKNMWSDHSNVPTLSVGACVICTVLQTIVYFLIAWHLMNGGTFKIPFLKRYKGRKSTPIKEHYEEMIMNDREESYFENVHRTDVYVSFHNVSKTYNIRGEKLTALTNVNLNIHKKLITVILGHNGAGKTTLMSILTGMVKPSSGVIQIDGVSHSNKDVRHLIGYCSQLDVVNKFMTVQQHCVFFGMLKGQTKAQAFDESEKLLKKLNIWDQKDCLPSELSGGMLRRLQLACAMSGRSRLLVLDEPSSGLDLQSRRELWDLILELRKTCTIFLSTHYLEEADALADNVAILHQGMIVALASPMHLKHAVGLGFHLSMHMTDNYSLDQVQSHINAKIPNAFVKSNSNKTIVFVLPSKDSHLFVPLFESLEAEKQSLGIISLSVGETSLEDAFLKIINIENQIVDVPIEHQKLKTGVQLYLQQVYILFIRQFKFLRTRLFACLANDIIVPLYLIYSFSFGYFGSKSSEDSLKLDLNMYSVNTQKPKSIYYTLGDDYKYLLSDMKSSYPLYEFIESSDIINDTLAVGNKNLEDYKDIIGGVLINSTDAKVYYTTTVRHVLPSIVHMLYNMLGQLYAGNVSQMFTTYVKSTPVESKEQPMKMSQDKHLWCFVISFVSCVFMVQMLILPIKERVAKVRHCQIMTGCSLYVHWLSTYLYHILFYVLIIMLNLTISLIITDVDNEVTTPVLNGFCFVLFLNVLSALPFFYVMTFIFNDFTRLQTWTLILILLLGCVLPFVATFFPGYGIVTSILVAFGSLTPIYHFPIALSNVFMTMNFNQLCNKTRPFCVDNQIPILEGIDLWTEENMFKCCAGNNNPFSYFETYFVADIVPMVLTGFLFWAIVVLFEYNLISIIYNRIVNNNYMTPEKKYHDDLVQKEEAYVSEQMKHGASVTGAENCDIHLTHNLHKRYNRLFKKNEVLAVRGITLSIKRGEILGFLGVNGSGKSTTFNMLTGQIAKTRGELYCNGHNIDRSRFQYLSSIVYCPQFGGVDDYLGIYDNLLITCVLKGIPLIEAYNIAREWSNMSRANSVVPIHLLSGGEQRHCTTLATLAASRHIALLDEPTAGVDVVARRTIWKALTSMNKTIVLSSHSMEETEALCSRIAILSQGELVALATPIQLRTERANGFNVTLKLNFTNDDTIMDRMNEIKNAFIGKLDCKLTDQHQTILRFHIDIGYSYSQLFTMVEELKKQYLEIVFYTVNETSLEEVFMAIVKQTQPTQVETV